MLPWALLATNAERPTPGPELQQRPDKTMDGDTEPDELDACTAHAEQETKTLESKAKRGRKKLVGKELMSNVVGLRGGAAAAHRLQQ